MPRHEDFLFQLGGVHPAQQAPYSGPRPDATRFAVIREDGTVMHESTMRSVAELWRFAYAPESATVEVVQ